MTEEKPDPNRYYETVVPREDLVVKCRNGHIVVGEEELLGLRKKVSETTKKNTYIRTKCEECSQFVLAQIIYEFFWDY